MNKLLILDKDGTLVKPKSGNTFVQHPEDQELLPGVAEVVARYAGLGYKVAIASNQGGVAAGYKTLEDAWEEMKYCMRLLPEIDLGLLCPDAGESCYRIRRAHLEKDWLLPGCSKNDSYGLYRKPHPGMLNFAIFYDLRASDGWDVAAEVKRRSIFVGDRDEDQQAAQAANIPFMWAHDWRGAISH